MKGRTCTVALLTDASQLAGPIPGIRLRALTARTTAAQVGFATAALLSIGVLLSIATTPDPLWWQLHFSRLGTFSVFSGYVFNSTIVACAVGVVAFAACLRVEMVRHAGTAVLTNRRSAVFVPLLVALLGINLSLVGFFPQNTNEFVHDRGSTGAVFCFTLILMSSRWMLRGMHVAVSRVTRRIGVGMVVTIAVYIAGFINMAAFELIVFSQVFFWLLFFARNIGRPARALPPPRERPATGQDAPHRRCRPARPPRRSGDRVTRAGVGAAIGRRHATRSGFPSAARRSPRDDVASTRPGATPSRRCPSCGRSAVVRRSASGPGYSARSGLPSSPVDAS